MKNKSQLVSWIVAFFCLNLYTHLLPSLFDFQTLHWFAFWLGFFVLAFLLARYVLQLEGLASFGLTRHRGWFFNLTCGFLMGFVVWAIKYFSFYSLHKFDLSAKMEASYFLPMLAQAFIAMFFASAINDLMIRGYWLALLKKEGMMKWYVGVTSLLYALDDCWNEALTGMNLLFSAILGISLAYSVLRTGSIWICIGIHWGGNMIFRAMYGFNGAGIWKIENVKESVFFDFLSLVITSLLLPMVYLFLKVWPQSADKNKQDGFSSAASKLV